MMEKNPSNESLKNVVGRSCKLSFSMLHSKRLPSNCGFDKATFRFFHLVSARLHDLIGLRSISFNCRDITGGKKSLILSSKFLAFLTRIAR